MTTKRATSRANTTEQELPDAQALEALVTPVSNFAQSTKFLPLRQSLYTLRQRPPQVLLLEGGTTAQRLACAHFWASSLNCPHGTEQPCLCCPVCLRIITHMHRDIFFFDGAAGTIKIADVRDIRSTLNDPPREAAYRLVIFHEAQALLEVAANALLKSLEEPKQHTLFLLAVPQRERLLPTLVSRSSTLTLPWPLIEENALLAAPHMQEWEERIVQFLTTGQGLFAHTGTKGLVTVQLVQEISLLLSYTLVQCLHAVHTKTKPSGALAPVFMRMPLQRLRMAEEVLAECQESLMYMVNPVAVLEWMLTRLFLLLPR